jgi:hypothetical protein
MSDMSSKSKWRLSCLCAILHSFLMNNLKPGENFLFLLFNIDLEENVREIDYLYMCSFLVLLISVKKCFA